MADLVLDAEKLERLELDPDAVAALVARLARYVEQGRIPSGQLALARCGEVAVTAAAGRARCGGETVDVTPETLYAGFSVTKVITSAAAWILLQEGAFALDDRVSDLLPGFERHGKHDVRVHHLLTHTAGFPSATFDGLAWDDVEKRLDTFASWPLEWRPGERFTYHPTSSMWVVAELITRHAGVDFRAFIRDRIVEPLGLPDLHVGIGPELSPRMADLCMIGEAPTPEESRDASVDVPPQFVASNDDLLRMNQAAYRAEGEAGGGGIMTAASLALFYQAILNDGRAPDGTRIWQGAILDDALRVHSGALLDPMTGRAALRGLGVVIAGDDERIFRSFSPGHSERAFGHAGAGGQVAWADPESGLSFAYLCNGMERDPMKLGGRALSLSTLAVACART